MCCRGGIRHQTTKAGNHRPRQDTDCVVREACQSALSIIVGVILTICCCGRGPNAVTGTALRRLLASLTVSPRGDFSCQSALSVRNNACFLKSGCQNKMRAALYSPPGLGRTHRARPVLSPPPAIQSEH